MKNLLWPLFVVFVVAAIYSGWHPEMFTFTGPGKLLFWIAFIVFTAYSIYCSSKENLFKTIGVMSRPALGTADRSRSVCRADDHGLCDLSAHGLGRSRDRLARPAVSIWQSHHNALFCN